MKEIWKIIKGFENYKISNLGRIKALERKVRFVSKAGNEAWRVRKEKFISTQLQNGGYEIAHLYVGNKRIAKTIHSLVAEAFIGKRPFGYDVCHINGIRTANRASNLRYDTRSNNFKDMHKHGTYYLRTGGAKLLPSQVYEIRASNQNIATLMKQFKISREQIGRIKRGDAWKNLK